MYFLPLGAGAGNQDGGRSLLPTYKTETTHYRKETEKKEVTFLLVPPCSCGARARNTAATFDKGPPRDPSIRRKEGVPPSISWIYRGPDGRLIDGGNAQRWRPKSSSPHHLLHPFRCKGGKRRWRIHKTYGDASSFNPIHTFVRIKKNHSRRYVISKTYLENQLRNFTKNLVKIQLLDKVSYYDTLLLNLRLFIV